MTYAFESPNYTQVPNVVIDELMAKLTPAEFKCMINIIHKTFGFHRREAPISINEFQSKCNLSRQGVINTVKSLEMKGWVTIYRSANNTDSNRYGLDVANLCSQPTN